MELQHEIEKMSNPKRGVTLMPINLAYVDSKEYKSILERIELHRQEKAKEVDGMYGQYKA